MRPIDADDLKEYVSSMSPKGIFSEWETAGIYGAIDRQPTLDIEPVRHGRWIEERDIFGKMPPCCSVCGEEDIFSEEGCGTYYKPPYCPWRGAKMDLEEE